MRHLTRCCIVYRQIRRTPSPEPGPLRWVQQEPSAIAARCVVCGHFPCVHEYFLLADAGRSHAACGACVTSPCSPRAPASRAGGRWTGVRTGDPTATTAESRASIYQPSSSISHRWPTRLTFTEARFLPSSMADRRPDPDRGRQPHRSFRESARLRLLDRRGRRHSSTAPRSPLAELAPRRAGPAAL